MKITAATFVLILAVTTSFADEGTPLLAASLSVIPGLGHIYNGETDKGVGIMISAVWVSSLMYGYGKRNNYHEPLFDAKTEEDDKILYFLGGLALAGASLWSGVDAYNTANSSRVTLAPLSKAGVRLSYSF